MSGAEIAQIAGFVGMAGAGFTVVWNAYVGRKNLANSESQNMIDLLRQERDLYRQRWEDCMGGRPTPEVQAYEDQHQHGGFNVLTLGAAAGGGFAAAGLVEAIWNAIRHGGIR